MKLTITNRESSALDLTGKNAWITINGSSIHGGKVAWHHGTKMGVRVNSTHYVIDTATDATFIQE